MQIIHSSGGAVIEAESVVWNLKAHTHNASIFLDALFGNNQNNCSNTSKDVMGDTIKAKKKKTGV